MVFTDLRESRPLTSPEPSRGGRLLVLGAAAGIALAAHGLVEPHPSGQLPADTLAIVNGSAIRAVDYQRALADVAADRRDGVVDEALRRHVRDRLIDEELLVQRGLALGLARSDRRVRGELTGAVIGAVLADLESEPTDAEVETLYAEQPAFFRQPGRVQVEQIFFGAPGLETAEEAERRAAAARHRLDGGEEFASLRATGDPEPVPLPAEPLSPDRLVDYLGPTLTRATLTLGPGEVAGPVRSGWGYHLLRLVERAEPTTPPLAALREEARQEFRRRAGDRRLRRYLDELRREAEVVVNEDLP